MKRVQYLKEIERIFEVHAVCALLGPRQVGKTTLARMYTKELFDDEATFFDLENERDLARLENPYLTFSLIRTKLIVIDEIQLRPDLFKVLRVVVDDPKNTAQFLILGSASRDLLNQSSETLAGRIGYIELPPFSLFEIHASDQLWLRGGFPKSYLAKTDDASYLWRQNYIRTFLERDIPQLGFFIPPAHMRRVWTMLAHYHGQTINYSEIAKSLMLSDATIKKYIDILVGTFMIRVLSPWFENISKRQVKSSKLYFRDTGILYALLGITSKEQRDTHPKLGAFWEGFALEEIIRAMSFSTDEFFFWSTQAHAELDLLVMRHGKRYGFEFKYSDAPRTTKSMHSALQDLSLDKLIIIYPGNQNYPLTEKIMVCGLDSYVDKHESFL